MINLWEGGKSVRANRESMLLESGGRIRAPRAAEAADDDSDSASLVDLTGEDAITVKREPKPAAAPRVAASAAAKPPTAMQRVAAAAEQSATSQESVHVRIMEQMARQHSDLMELFRMLVVPQPVPVQQQPVFVQQPLFGASVLSSPPRLEPAFAFAPPAAAAAAAAVPHSPSVIGSDDATALQLGTQAAHAARSLEAALMTLPALPRV